MSPSLMPRVARMLVLGVVAAAAGCGSSEQTYAPVQQTVEITPTDNVRSFLEGVAQSGMLDSGAIVLKENIEQMKAQGATNTEELQKDADELLAMSNPGQVKAKATEMLGKLPMAGATPAPAPSPM